MSDPINLNRARKAKLKSKERETAAVNRTKFGRAKSAKAVEDAARLKARTRLDQAKREP